jgi:hypothetical protein
MADGLFTTKLTRIGDFELPDGRIDWSCYRAAQLSNGEFCTRCGGLIVEPHGKPTLCVACVRLDQEISAKSLMGP